MPKHGCNHDGPRNIRFVPVAPPNYYQSLAATMPPVQPPMRNVR